MARGRRRARPGAGRADDATQTMSDFRTERDLLGDVSVPADALYGVSMRGDGVTHVISQRLRERVAV